MELLTRFRAYQLDSAGALYSYYSPDQFALVEARLPKGGVEVIASELETCNRSKIDLLHITSWDSDHVSFIDLTQIINHFRPSMIEVPSYKPDHEMGQRCRNILEGYDEIHGKYVQNVRFVTKDYLKSLSHAEAWGMNNIVINPNFNDPCKNNMSLMKLFRSRGFNVASFGDCESSEISARISIDGSILNSETDVMILAHHGANNGFTNKNFLEKVRPSIAVCNSNYGNQYDHPKPEIRQMLHELNIPIFTTKTGDVIIQQKNGQKAEIYNLISDNQALSSSYLFIPKRYQQ